jgi:NTE family protein
LPEPVRRVLAQRPTVLTLPGERPPGTWRYSSRLALVLSGGGARAAYQAGVLAGLAERLPELAFPILTGVSAGAISVTYLATHEGPLRTAVSGLVEQWRRLTVDQVYRVRPTRFWRNAARWMIAAAVGRQRGPATVQGMLDLSPLREFLSRNADMGGIDRNIAAGRLRAAALSALSLTSGQTVTFVHGAPGTPVWQRAQRLAVRASLTVDHVLASAAIPMLFPAVRMGDQFFGDGSVRQTAPLAPAIHLGARAVVVIGLRAAAARDASPPGEYPTAAEVLAVLFHSVFLDALEADVERLERINGLLAALPQDAQAPGNLKPVDLLVLRPSRDLGALAAGHWDLLPRTIRWLARAMGGHQQGASDLLGYLLFHPAYTSQLVELGYEDVMRNWDAIEPFFARLERRGEGEPGRTG